MEYIMNNGTKVVVVGDKSSVGNSPLRRRVIGANYAHGARYGGYLSSFQDKFTDELIGVESGIGDNINVRIGDISEAYRLLDSKMMLVDSNDIVEVARAVGDTVDEYFAGIKNVRNRLDYYRPEDEENSENNYISNLKGTGAAMCAERAALSQNLLKYLGLNSVYKASGITKNGEKEVHCYNLLEFNGKHFIFDSSIPNSINNHANPLICEIDKESFDLLSYPLAYNGISISVSHYNPYRDYDVDITYDSGRNNKKTFDHFGIEKGTYK